MNTMTEQATKFRLWYNRWAPLVLTICLVIGVGAAIIGTAGIYRNSSTQKQLVATQADLVATQADLADTQDDQAQLLACVEQFASASSSSSKATRSASQRKDDATAVRDDALNAEGEAFLMVTKGILTGAVTPADVQALNRALEARAVAGRALDKAQAALDRARANNPIPDPPSVFCQEDDKEGATQ